MEYRGPILLVFGLSLVVSPVAINLATTGTFFATDQQQVGHVAIDTGCGGQSMSFLDSSLCTQNTNASAGPARARVMPGGALFVAARH